MTDNLLQAIAEANAIKSQLMDLLMERNDSVSDAWAKTAKLVPESQRKRLEDISRKTNHRTAQIDTAIFTALAQYHEASENVHRLMETHQ